jgi:hypothetical protein
MNPGALAEVSPGPTPALARKQVFAMKSLALLHLASGASGRRAARLVRDDLPPVRAKRERQSYCQEARPHLKGGP